MRRSFLLALVAVVALANPIHAAIFTVDSTLDEVDAAPGDGTCASAGGRCTLRAAIQETNALASADRIDLPAGHYVLTIPGNLENQGATGDLDVRGELEIVGAGAAATAVDGAGLDRVLDVIPSSPFGPLLSLAGMTIQNGYNPNGAGGGVQSFGPLRVTDSVIRDNFANTGGGLYDTGLVVERSRIENNTSGSGGGIQAWDAVTIVDSVIANNRAIGTHGGGVLHLSLFGGRLHVERSTFSGNEAAQAGGGIKTTSDGATLVNATISGNRAGKDGGGIFRGGGYAVDGVPHTAGPVLIVSSTITENHADADADGTGEGAGVASDTDPEDPGRDVTVRNSIIAGNFDDSPVGARYVIDGSSDCAPGLTAEGRNLIQDVDGCTIVGNVAGVLVGTSAFLAPLQDNGGATPTHALQIGSPAIDAGDPYVPGTGGSACEIRDQRGVTRPQPGGCDLGAYELEVDLCASPATGCKAAAPGKSKLRLDRAAGKEPRLQWTWKGAATSVGDLGAPIEGSDYVLCVFDAASGLTSRVLTAVMPGGPCPDRPCWKPSGKGFRYHNRAATPTGIEILALKPGGDGKASIGIKGSGMELPLPSLPLTSEPRVLVQLIRSDVGTCWEASYGTPRVNTSVGFAATSD